MSMTDRRSALDIAVEFVRDQSCGEWDDKTINDDAAKLVEKIIEPERATTRKLEAALATAEDALTRISRAKPDQLDHALDVAIIERAARISVEALRAIEQIMGA